MENIDGLEKRHYCLGFLIDKDKESILLILKTHPEYQKNKYNGIGGKVNNDESSYDAMCREFREETGLDFSNWQSFAELTGVNRNNNYWYQVDCFVGFIESFISFDIPYPNIDPLSEMIFIIPIEDILIDRQYPLVDHVKWLVAMAISTQGLFRVEEVELEF